MKFRPDWTPTEMPFLEHLEELRRRIFWSLGALGVGTVIAFIVVTNVDLLGLLVRPIEPFLHGDKLKYLGPADPFFLTLKLAVVCGFLLAFPVIAYQVWAFVAPALLPAERRAIVPSLYLGLVLFLLGAALAYFVVLPLTLNFMMGFQVGTLEPNIIAGPYLSFVVKLLLGFGIAFELPVVMLILASMGLVDSKGLAEKRRFAIAGSAVLSAILTPGDVLSTVIMMGPLIILYELSIILTKLVQRRREEGEEPRSAPDGAVSAP